MTPTKSMTLGYLNTRKGDIWVVNDLDFAAFGYAEFRLFFVSKISAVFSLREKTPLNLGVILCHVSCTTLAMVL